ncbi:hypothetical protein VMCG_02019 [Cytospora schulzeri]|uniref:F-box domain-containing protein n=1 Tax=Cytospora schulzeri TaxID=448051 RepID=A0A423X2L0_9PEZI|nr:hypothetical protein VMCG_02019 [Valsa malicola]
MTPILSPTAPRSATAPQARTQDSDPKSMYRLPNELLINILKKSPDFTTLNSLIETSSRLFLLFSNNSHEIVEAVLAAAVPTETESVMRAVLQIRTRTFRCRSWNEAPEFPIKEYQGLYPISPKASPRLLRMFVGLAHKLHLLTHSCLDSCLDRCRPRFALPERSCLDSYSYTEEQRLVLGFWFLQYFFEIKVGRLRGRLDWGSEDLVLVQSATVDHVYSFSYSICHQYALTAYDFVQELRRSASATPLPPPKSEWSASTEQYRIPAPPTPVGGRYGSFPSCPPRPSRIPSGSKVVDKPPLGQDAVDSGRPVAMQQGQSPAPIPAPILDGITDGFHYQPHPPLVGPDWKVPDEPALSKETAGWEAFLRLSHSGHYMPQHFIWDVGFGTYRKLGMAIWDKEKIIQLGLWQHELPLDNKSRLRDAWIQILSEDELAAVLARLKEEEDEW